MADAPEKDLNPRLLFAVIGAVLLFLWVALEISDRRFAQRIDLAERCDAGETGQCFTDEDGRITSVERDRVTVAYDDGRKIVQVMLAADSVPDTGESVRLERWDGLVVSLYVPARERRYHTIHWPRRWDPYALWIGVLGALCVLPAGSIGLRKVLRLRSRTGSRDARAGARSRGGRAPSP